MVKRGRVTPGSQQDDDSEKEQGEIRQQVSNEFYHCYSDGFDNAIVANLQDDPAIIAEISKGLMGTETVRTAAARKLIPMWKLGMSDAKKGVKKQTPQQLQVERMKL